ncbi:MAG: carboxypeptidase regulatory-like domain-containing protein [Methanobacteriota archaeon]|nr:MAG: carboxypeptidase regulatory-like domain-containing protein [Euryarchaeota archaeon]
MGTGIIDQRRLNGGIAAVLVVLCMTVAMLLPAVTLKAETFDVTDSAAMSVTGEAGYGSDAGRSVALLDINGDGAADLVVGDPFDNEGGPNAGKVLIYLGNTDPEAPLDSDPDVVITGTAGGRLGWALAYAGHVNEDNIDDLIVGAPWSQSGPQDYRAGKVFIFFGYSGLGGDPAHLDLDTTDADVEITGSAESRLGYSVSTCGDLNGDAHADVVVGAPFAAELTGEAHIYYGGDPMDDIVDKTFLGPSDNDYFGWSVVGGTNVDGTPQKDIAVGAPGVGGGKGAVQVILNPAKSVPKVITLQPSTASTERFGEAIALVDINDDGYGDVAVGAPLAGDAGKVYVYYGSSTVSKFDKNVDFELSVGSEGDEFGTSLAAGDPRTDSIGDLVVGAPYNDEGATDGGRVYVFHGNSSIEQYTEPDIIAQGSIQSSRFGCSVASGTESTADFNSDEAADFAVGANDDGVTGAAYLYLGELAPVEDRPTLSGYVTDSNDDPLVGALVLVENSKYYETFSTTDDGSYGVVEDISVPPGVYDITASYDDYFAETVSDLDMILGGVYQEDFILTKYPVISGKIFDGLSPLNPLQGVLVQALDDADEVLDEMTTDSSGLYEFILPYKDIQVRIKASMQDYLDEFSDAISVQADGEYLDTDLTIHHKPVLLVTVEDGFLSGPDDWIEGAEVVVTIADVVVATGTTDVDGETSMIVDDVGVATVTVTAVGYEEGEDTITLEEDILDTELPFSLNRQPAIVGVVEDKDDGTPIAGAEVERFEDGEYLDTAVTGSYGTFSFDIVEAGTYVLTASAVGYVPQTITDVDVAASETVNIDFSLESDSLPPASSATGIVPNPDPVTNVITVLDFIVEAEATDSKSEIEIVQLYWRKGETGDFQSSDDLVDDETPYAFDFVADKGDGVYSFYTIATDCAGNTESAPADGANDTWVVVVTGIPASTVEEIVPYEQKTDTFSVTVDSDHVFPIIVAELWYSFNGGPYDMCAEVGDAVPYTWDFFAVYGDGVYSFYSIVEDQYERELEPEDPDTSALVDTTAPEVTIISPEDGEDFRTDPDVPLAATATDDGAGLALVGYRVDSGDDEIIDLDGESSYELDEMLTLSDGTHTIAVWAVDTLGWGSGEVMVTIDVDVTKPELVITSPEDGLAMPTGDVWVSWTVNEEVTTRISLDGGWEPVPEGETSYLFSDLDNGFYTVTVEVTDLAGHEETQSSTFWVDTELPKVEIVEPGFFATSDIVIEWFQEDLITGLKTSQVRLDEGDWENADTEVENVEHTFYSVSDGVHTVEVKVVDEAGNEMWDDATFEVDGTAPVIVIDSPYDGQIVPIDSVEFVWSIEDDGTGVKGAEYKLDTGAWEPLPSNAGSITLSDLSDGSHTLIVVALDMANNEDDEDVQFVVDTTNPTVSISSPTENETLYTSDIDIVYAADDTGTGVDSVEYSVDGGDWEAAAPSPILLEALDDGDYTVEIRATDLAGHSTTAIVNFTVDAFVLDVEITDPEDGAMFNTDSVTVTWTVSDQDATVEVKLDDGAWQPAIGSMMVFSDLADGEHTVTVHATDDASNEGSDSVTFTVDTTPPDVSIESPEDDAIIASSSVDVSWSVSTDAETTEYSVDGGAWQAVDGTSVTVSSLTDGEHTISIRATDIVGNEASDSVTITVDTTDPSVEITAPSEGATVGTEVVVQWTSDDGTGSGVETAEISIDGGAWETATTISSHTLTDLADGQHTVDVKATDVAGNEGTDSVTFTVVEDDTAPTVSITSPTDASSLPSSTVTVTWTASDGTGSGIATIEIMLDGGAWTAVTGTSHAFTDLDEGSHTASVRATDNAGNSAMDSVTFMVDTVNPTLTITSPADGLETEDKVVIIEWTCDDAGCGIDRIEVCIDDGSFVSVGTASEHTFSDLEVGEHTVEVRAYDKAGNMVEESVTFSVTDEDGGVSALLIGGIVVLAIIILAAVAVMLMRKKKAGTTPPPPEE